MKISYDTEIYNKKMRSECQSEISYRCKEYNKMNDTEKCE